MAILLFHWESWLGFGMTINPGKRKTRRFALGKFTHCSRKQKEKGENKIETKNMNQKRKKERKSSDKQLIKTLPQAASCTKHSLMHLNQRLSTRVTVGDGFVCFFLQCYNY